MLHTDRIRVKHIAVVGKCLQTIDTLTNCYCTNIYHWNWHKLALSLRETAFYFSYLYGLVFQNA